MTRAKERRVKSIARYDLDGTTSYIVFGMGYPVEKAQNFVRVTALLGPMVDLDLDEAKGQGGLDVAGRRHSFTRSPGATEDANSPPNK